MGVKKLVATGLVSIMGILSAMGVVGASLEVNETPKEKNVIVEMLVPSTEAYTFSSTGGITIESQDVNEVTDAALVGVASFFQILKFVGLAILIGVSVFIVNKIFSISKIGS